MPRHQTDCRYFANGICSKGNACSFVHDVATRNENICQFNLAGKCSFGQACRFKHTRPSNSARTSSSPPPPSNPPSTSSRLPAASQRVRPVQLAQPGLNVEAVEFVPSWKKKSYEPPMSYAAAAASTSSTSAIPNDDEEGSSQAKHILCPYHLKNGDCQRVDYGCPFTHGDKCDMCNQWTLHPDDEEQRRIHQSECVAAHTHEMERAFLMQKTEEKSCGICMENIAEKNLRFGILNGCQHCFCLECIRQWRTQDQRAMDMATKTVRSCPECRQHSDYVIPSLFWVESGQEKELLIQMYKENTKSQVCKYYSRNNKRRGDCPFGNKCFYKHQLPDGSIDPGESPHARRRARLVDYIFEEDDDLLLGEDDEDFDLSENGSGFRRFMENLDRNSGQGELFRIITSFVRELQGDDRPHRTP